jgi:hypothetical protein
MPREIKSKSADPIKNTNKSWMPDGRYGEIRFEDKFGERANLTNNQKLAQPSLKENFWLNHFLPSDVGKAASIPAGSVAPQMTPRNK